MTTDRCRITICQNNVWHKLKNGMRLAYNYYAFMCSKCSCKQHLWGLNNKRWGKMKIFEPISLSRTHKEWHRIILRIYNISNSWSRSHILITIPNLKISLIEKYIDKQFNIDQCKDLYNLDRVKLLRTLKKTKIFWKNIFFYRQKEFRLMDFNLMASDLN